MATVYERVREIVADKLSVEEENISENTSFVENLGADSLDLVEMIMAFEENFSTDDNTIEITDEEAGEISTVGKAVAWLKEHSIEDE